MSETRVFNGKIYKRVPRSFWTKKEAERWVEDIRDRGDSARMTLLRFSEFTNFPLPQKRGHKTGTEYTVWYRSRK
jgi:hypothetical protein